MPDRLDKLVAASTQYSRKQAGELIKRGRVQVNSAVVTAPNHPCQEGAALTLDGSPLITASRFFMLNKPTHVVCATRDNHDPTVLDLVAEGLRKGLFPAGRLDKDAEGFVLLTDDGSFAHRLLSPKSKVPKTYHVTLDKAPNPVLLRDLFSHSMDLGSGDVTSPAILGRVEDVEVTLTIFEGVYHQVKRMFAKAGYKVIRLRRIRIGGLDLDPALSPGQYRALTQDEQSLLIETKTPD